jgi:hypothetical protein
MRTLLFIITFIFGTLNLNAQNASSGATQNVGLNLSNAITISFTGTGTNNGNTVNMSFNTVSDYLNGVSSSAQQLKVQSNLGFNVAVKFDVNSFQYIGQGILNLLNIPTNAFQAKVTANGTGGSIASPFSSTSFAPIYANDQNIITNGQYGGNQTFSVMYKCVPGLALPSGTYNINIVYTATQL